MPAHAAIADRLGLRNKVTQAKKLVAHDGQKQSK